MSSKKCLKCKSIFTGENLFLYKCTNCNFINFEPSIDHIPHEVLRDVVLVYGFSVFDDELRFQGILKDLMPFKLIHKIFLAFVRDKIHIRLNKIKNSYDENKLNSIKYIFSTENLIYKDISDYCVDCFAYALGVKHNLKLVDKKKVNNWFKNNSGLDKLTVYKKIEPVKILNFSLIDPLIIENEEYTVFWEAKNFTRAYINNKEISIFQKKIVFKATKYENLVLRVENIHYEDERNIEISPLKRPVINNFTSSNIEIKEHDEVLLSWKASNYYRTSLFFDNKEIDVSQKINIKLTPLKSADIILKAFSKGDLIVSSKTLSIKIVKPIYIKSFSLSKDRIIETDKISLKWDVENAEKIVLQPLNIDVTSKNKIKLTPLLTTTYVLEVSNTCFSMSEVRTVIVHKRPSLSAITLPQIPALNLSLPNLKMDDNENELIIRTYKNTNYINKFLSLDFPLNSAMFKGKLLNLSNNILRHLKNKIKI
jgi:hypothetical protein